MTIFGDRNDGDPPREEDTHRDQNSALSRAIGGDEGQGLDAGSTTGTGENQEFVGRVSGQDVGFEEETGAEVRAQAEAEQSPT